MTKQRSKNVFGSRSGVSFGDGTSHARNTKEVVMRMYDWFTVDLPTSDVAGTAGVTAYSLDLSQNFFNPQPGSTSSDTGNLTKNRISRVVLDVMTPGGPITYNPDQSGATVVKQTALPMIQAGVPCMEYESGTVSPSPSSLVGQSSLVLHPDLRRPWVTVGSWNYDEIFRNTLIQPWYADTKDEAGYMELFRIRAVDGVDGVLMAQPSSGSEPVFLSSSFQFRVMIEIACPIALVPQPKVAVGVDPFFAGPQYNATYTEERTPMQYQLMSLQNAL